MGQHRNHHDLVRRRRHPSARIYRIRRLVALCLLTVTVAVGVRVLYARIAPETTPIGQTAPITRDSGPINLLLVGSDERTEPDGSGAEGSRNDVTMLVHTSPDRRGATLISLPRDLMVGGDIVAGADGCSAEPGTTEAQFNTALGMGGLRCVAAMASGVTGQPVDAAALIDFDGVVALTDTLDGVDVDFPAPIDDDYSGLRIPEPGRYSIKGDRALQLLRTRHGVGDGSDLGRITLQQTYMTSLARTLREDSNLDSVGGLLTMAETAHDHMVFSDNLGSVQDLVSLARELKKIDPAAVRSVTWPWTSDGQRLQIDTVEAENVKQKLENNEPVGEVADNGVH